MKASDLMTRSVVTCRTTDTLEHAAQLMSEHDIGCVAVVDPTGCLAGLITDRDICLTAYARDAALRQIGVWSAMSSPVITATADEDVGDIEVTMQRRQIRRIAIVDGREHPIGVISLNDIARASAHGQLSMNEVACTLAAVCEPRATTAHAV